MAVERREITSLKAAPEGWSPQVLGRREWGAPHPAYNTMPDRFVPNGPREDAESTAELPELTPGLSRLPTSCTHCGGQFLTNQPPLDGDRRGMITCNTCSRQVCWLRPAIDATSRSVPTSRPAPPTISSGPPAPRTLRPVVGGRFDREEGCGPSCSIAFGHDPTTHQDYGFKLGLVEIESKPTGIVRTGCLALDFDTLDVLVNGQPAMLTATETKILVALVGCIGKLITRPDLVAQVWGSGMVEQYANRRGRNESSIVNTFLGRLRASLGPAADLIQTIPGRGLILRKEPPVDDAPKRARPRVRLGRLPHRLDVRPGRHGGLILARSRARGVPVRPFLVRRRELSAMTSNGTAAIETVETAVAIAEISTAVVVTQIPPLPEPAPAPVEKLSALDQADRWFADVVRMRDALAEEEAELLARLGRVRSTRERLGQVVAIFEAPAAPIAVEMVARPAPMLEAPASLDAPAETATKPWSQDHSCCRICGTTERKHAGNGRCKDCSNYWYRKGEERPAELWNKEQTS